MASILNLAIGLVFIFLLFSLVVSAANELILSFWRRREQLLREGIGELLHDRHFLGKACDLYAHPLIASLSRKADGEPNYIPQQAFVSALLDLIKPADAEAPRTLADLEAAIEKLAQRGVSDVQAAIDTWAGTDSEKMAVAKNLKDALDGIERHVSKQESFLNTLAELEKKVSGAQKYVDERANLATDPQLAEALKATTDALKTRPEAADLVTAVEQARSQGPVDDEVLKPALEAIVTLFRKDQGEAQEKLEEIKKAADGSTATFRLAQRRVLEDFVEKHSRGHKWFRGRVIVSVAIAVAFFGVLIAEFSHPSARTAVRLSSLVAGATVGVVLGVAKTRRKGTPAAPVATSDEGAAQTIQVYLSEEKLKATLAALLDDAKHDLDAFKARLGDWFDNSMRRVTGWYKNQTQCWLFILGIVLAVAGNIDALHIMRYLANNPTVANNFADAIVQATGPVRQEAEKLKTAQEDLDKKLKAQKEASDAEKAPNPAADAHQNALEAGEAVTKAQKTLTEAQESLRVSTQALLPTAPASANTDLKAAQGLSVSVGNAISNLGGASIPVGWGSGERSYFLTKISDKPRKSKQTVPDSSAQKGGIPNPTKRLIAKLVPDGPPAVDPSLYRLDRSHCFSALLGFVLTALAGSLGAPFWFDTLNKIITVRSSGKKAEEQPAAKNG